MPAPRRFPRIPRLPNELWALTLLAFVTRCWRLFTPGEIVWDEVHFEEFASRYFSGAYYVDVHPPLGKLLFAAFAKFVGVTGVQLAAGTSAPELRILPAVAGALIIPFFWAFLRQLGASRKVALFGAAMLLLDNALLVQSRFVLMDSMLALAGLAAVTAYLVARRRDGASRWRWLVASALLAGAAVSIKWTGLSALGLIGLTWLVDTWRAARAARTPRTAGAHAESRADSTARTARELAVLALAPLAVYVATFAVHFALLPNDGIGVRYMTPAFAATRFGNAAYSPDASISFAAEFADLNRVMAAQNLEWSNTQHPAASKWYTWPISKHPVLFWQNDHADGDTEWIMLQGNPVLWWGTLVTLALFAAALAARRVRAGPQRDALLFLAAGYAMNFLPFALITRPMYLYHYFFGLLYSVALASFAVGLLAGWMDRDDDALWRFPSARSRGVFVAAVALVALSFAYFAPMSYGTRLSREGLAHRRWLLEAH